MKRLLFFFMFCLSLIPLSADTLVLRNGKKIEGKIVSVSKFQVRMRTANGVKSVSRSSIRRIVYGAVKSPKKKDEAAEKRKAEERRKRRDALRKKREAARKKATEKKTERKPTRKVEKKPARRRPARRQPARVEGNPLLRSAVLPGRGQNSQGRNPAAYAYGGGFFAFAALGLALEWENQNLIIAANGIQEELELMIAVRGLSGDSLDLWQTLRLDTARERTNTNIRLSNSVWAIAGAIYVANLIDVSLAGGSSLGLDLRPDGGNLVFRIRF